MAATPDGKTLVVGGHLPEDAGTNVSISSRVRFINTETGATTVIRLDVGAMNIRDMILTPDGRYAFLTGSIGHFQQMPNSVTGGWMNENILFVVDVPGRKIVTSHRLDDFAIGSANPWGVSLSDDGRFLLVAAAGSCDVMLINAESFVRMLDGFAGYPQRGIDATDIISKLPMHLRVPVGLKGVRHAVMTENRIFATSYFEDAVVKIEPQFTEPLRAAAGVMPRDSLEIPRLQRRWSLRPDTATPIRMNLPEQMTLAENAHQKSSSVS